MKTGLFALAIALAPALVAAPALGQTRGDQMRWEQAQRRFENERNIYAQERDRYEASRRGRGGYRGGGYDRGGGGGGYDRGGDNYRWQGGQSDWDAAHYYHEDTRYEERQLGSNDEVYRGSDGRYYCRRSDGTTGLVIGAGVGALAGHAIDRHGERTTGTVVGGVIGALVGREAERSSDMRCR